MRKRRLEIYPCLTLLKQDIRDIVQIFQNNLRDVEVILDDIHIFDSAQLEQFNTTYQAASLIVRGSGYVMEGEDAGWQDERPFTELRMSKGGATLLLGQNNVERGESEVSIQIRKVLLRCENRIYSFLQMMAIWMFIGLPISLLPVFQQHHINYFLQIFLIIVLSFLLIPLAFFLFVRIIRFLRIQTQVFLFPGAVRAARAYGLRETIERLVVALILLIVLDASLLIALRIFWR